MFEIEMTQKKIRKPRNHVVRASLEYGHKAGKMKDERRESLNRKPKHKKRWKDDLYNEVDDV